MIEYSLQHNIKYVCLWRYSNKLLVKGIIKTGDVLSQPRITYCSLGSPKGSLAESKTTQAPGAGTTT